MVILKSAKSRSSVAKGTVSTITRTTRTRNRIMMIQRKIALGLTKAAKFKPTIRLLKTSTQTGAFLSPGPALKSTPVPGQWPLQTHRTVTVRRPLLDKGHSIARKFSKRSYDIFIFSPRVLFVNQIFKQYCKWPWGPIASIPGLRTSVEKYNYGTYRNSIIASSCSRMRMRSVPRKNNVKII